MAAAAVARMVVRSSERHAVSDVARGEDRDQAAWSSSVGNADEASDIHGVVLRLFGGLTVSGCGGQRAIGVTAVPGANGKLARG